ncbi:hypothetical protein BJV78DRAFT_1156464 [Lactifluus subvellereus]|nr:hypothetical protein BJV78DRAFT_1156464 [Lactifluus subvellereus]
MDQCRDGFQALLKHFRSRSTVVPASFQDIQAVCSTFAICRLLGSQQEQSGQHPSNMPGESAVPYYLRNIVKPEDLDDLISVVPSPPSTIPASYTSAILSGKAAPRHPHYGATIEIATSSRSSSCRLRSTPHVPSPSPGAGGRFCLVRDYENRTGIDMEDEATYTIAMVNEVKNTLFSCIWAARAEHFTLLPLHLQKIQILTLHCPGLTRRDGAEVDPSESGVPSCCAASVRGSMRSASVNTTCCTAGPAVAVGWMLAVKQPGGTIYWGKVVCLKVIRVIHQQEPSTLPPGLSTPNRCGVPAQDVSYGGVD